MPDAPPPPRPADAPAPVPSPAVAPPQAAPTPLLLGKEAVAALLGVSPRHVQNLDRSGRLPAPVRLGRCCRWRREEIEAWVAAGLPPRSRWTATAAKRGQR